MSTMGIPSRVITKPAPFSIARMMAGKSSSNSCWVMCFTRYNLVCAATDYRQEGSHISAFQCATVIESPTMTGHIQAKLATARPT